MITSCSICLSIKNFSHKSCREKQNTFYVQKLFFENRAVCYIQWKTTTQPERSKIIWRMRIVWLRPKATKTHSEYVIIIDFPPQQWLHEPASELRYTYTACLVYFLFEKSIRVKRWRLPWTLTAFDVSSGCVVNVTNLSCCFVCRCFYCCCCCCVIPIYLDLFIKHAPLLCSNTTCCGLHVSFTSGEAVTNIVSHCIPFTISFKVSYDINI
jgi:hypothetical protein